MPGDGNAAARIEPWLDAIPTRSPSPISRRSAVSRLISTQLLHIALDIGSGNSCINGRCASEPSRNAMDGYGRKWNPYSFESPLNWASEYLNVPPVERFNAGASCGRLTGSL